MFEQFSVGARTVVVDAQYQARRLRHDFIGCEHLLLAVCSDESAAATVLRGAGVTPSAVEAAIVRIVGRPSPALDREALATIGIDLDLVRTKIEAAFGPDAFDRPSRRLHRQRRWRRQRRQRCSSPAIGHLPLTPRAKRCFALALDEARHGPGRDIDVDHLALALISMEDGMAPCVLAAVTEISAARLRLEILERKKAAG
ncbi:MAG: Clp protease [Pseudonocardiales bacterium]|nr:MAG: Clp protease [Pseudonocardiales bacterium]